MVIFDFVLKPLRVVTHNINFCPYGNRLFSILNNTLYRMKYKEYTGWFKSSRVDVSGPEDQELLGIGTGDRKHYRDGEIAS